MIAMPLVQAVSNLPTDASALERSICALRSSIAALSSSVASLNSKAEFWEKWPYGFTAAVVIGVAMELWVIQHDWREDNETWALTFFALSRTIRPSWRKLWIEYVSVTLVALGVAGELAIGITINVINRHLRDDNATLQSDSNQLVALVTQLAGSAAQSAATAQHAADTVGQQANALEKQETGISLRLRGDEGSEAELRTQVAEQELLVIANETRHRMLPGVFNSLSEEAPAKVQIRCFDGGDTPMFARALSAALQSFGWDVSPIIWSPALPGGVTILNRWASRPAPTGVYNGVPGAAALSPAERSLMRDHPEIPQRQAHRLIKLAGGLVAKLKQQPGMDESSFEIWIGAGE